MENQSKSIEKNREGKEIQKQKKGKKTKTYLAVQIGNTNYCFRNRSVIPVKQVRFREEPQKDFYETAIGTKYVFL